MDANAQRRLFKRRIAEACDNLRVSFRQFKEARSFDEFVIDHLAHAETVEEMAVAALLELCAHDNNRLDFVVCIAIVSFLDETLGIPRQDADNHQRISDLAKILKSQPTDAAYRGWINSWYR